MCNKYNYLYQFSKNLTLTSFLQVPRCEVRFTKLSRTSTRSSRTFAKRHKDRLTRRRLRFPRARVFTLICHSPSCIPWTRRCACLRWAAEVVLVGHLITYRPFDKQRITVFLSRSFGVQKYFHKYQNTPPPPN